MKAKDYHDLKEEDKEMYFDILEFQTIIILENLCPKTDEKWFERFIKNLEKRTKQEQIAKCKYNKKTKCNRIEYIYSFIPYPYCSECKLIPKEFKERLK